MWMLYARGPAPNSQYWPGRRSLGVMDALAWPAALAIGVHVMPLASGVVPPVLLGLCGLLALRRCSRAIWRNEQYRFTTWQLGVPLALLVALGAVLRFAA